MNQPSSETYLIAARELLLTLGQSRPDLSAEAHANIQEAIEHIDRTHRQFPIEYE